MILQEPAIAGSFLRAKEITFWFVLLNLHTVIVCCTEIEQERKN